METITETIITESSMIGHNPSTPAGAGQAAGILISLEHLYQAEPEKAYIVTASEKFSYEVIAEKMNQYMPVKKIKGLILQADQAVLVENRLKQKIPVIDEVRHIKRLRKGKWQPLKLLLWEPA